MFLLIVSRKDNDDAVGYGLFMAFIPVILLVGALAWWIVGSMLRASPTMKQFILRSTLVMVGLALLRAFWGTWDSWERVKWGEWFAITLMTSAALGLTALPAAAIWWRWAIRPLSGKAPAASVIPPGA